MELFICTFSYFPRLPIYGEQGLHWWNCFLKVHAHLKKSERSNIPIHTDRSNTFNSCYVILYSKCFQIQQVVLLASFIICCIRGVTQAQQSADLNFMGRIVWPPHSHIFKGPMNLSFSHFLFKIVDFILFFYSSLLAIGNRFKASALAFYTDNMPLFPTNF